MTGGSSEAKRLVVELWRGRKEWGRRWWGRRKGKSWRPADGFRLRSDARAGVLSARERVKIPGGRGQTGDTKQPGAWVLWLAAATLRALFGGLLASGAQHNLNALRNESTAKRLKFVNYGAVYTIQEIMVLVLLPQRMILVNCISQNLRVFWSGHAECCMPKFRVWLILSLIFS
jgi:hypothetical protein